MWSRRVGRATTTLGSAGLAPETRNESASRAGVAGNAALPGSAVDLDSEHAAELRSRGTPKATVAQAGVDALADSEDLPASTRDARREGGGVRAIQELRADRGLGEGRESGASAQGGSGLVGSAPPGGAAVGQAAAGRGVVQRTSASGAVQVAAGGAGVERHVGEARVAAARVAAGSVATSGTRAGTSAGAPVPLALDRPQAMRGLLQRTESKLMARAEEPPLRQLASALAAAMRKGDGSVTINLRPEYLGPMRVDLRVEGRQASAIFYPTTESARQLLVASEGSLRTALEARGLRVDRIEVAALPDGATKGLRETNATHDGVGVAERERASEEDPRSQSQNQDEHAGAGGRGRSHGSHRSHGSRDAGPDLDQGRDGRALRTGVADGAEAEAAMGADVMRRIEGLLPALVPTVTPAVGSTFERVDGGWDRAVGWVEASA